MKLKIPILNLLTASFATLGLLALPGSAFAFNIEPQAGIKQTQPLMNGIGNTDEVNRTWTQTQRVVAQDKSIVVPTQKTQSNQPNFVKQPAQTLLAGIFMTFVLIGFLSGCVGSISGCLFQYRQYKRLTQQKSETLPLIDDLERIEKTNVPFREQQIETLERIWNMKS